MYERQERTLASKCETKNRTLNTVRVWKEHPSNSFARWNIYKEKFENVTFPFSFWSLTRSVAAETNPRVLCDTARNLRVHADYLWIGVHAIKRFFWRQFNTLTPNQLFPNTKRNVLGEYSQWNLHIASLDDMFSYFNSRRKEYRRAINRVLFRCGYVNGHLKKENEAIMQLLHC